jgi:hypothetical protein
MQNADMPRGRGRPSRAEASREALRGVDPQSVDPLDVLREIAADPSAPASARVAAVKALLAAERARAADAWNAKMGL